MNEYPVEPSTPPLEPTPFETVALQQDIEVTIPYATVLESYDHLGILKVRATPTEAALIAQQPGVTAVEEDSMGSGCTVQTTPYNMWALDRIDQRFSTLSGTYTYSSQGIGVNVYVIDSGGSSRHTDLTGRVRQGYNAINPGTPAEDDVYYVDANNQIIGYCHGELAATVIGGTTCGVAKQCNIIAVKFMTTITSGPDQGPVKGTVSQALAAINWVVADHQRNVPSVANMSFTFNGNSAIDQAVDALVSDNITVVCAAGNGNIAINVSNGLASPARNPKAITVGSIARDNTKSSISNFGTAIDLFAPGEDVWSGWLERPINERRPRDQGFGYFYGTSAASPLVAGAAAKYLQLNPGASPAAVQDYLKNQATVNGVINLNPNTANKLLYTIQ